MSEQPIIRVECVDSAGNNTSALELSKVAYWPNDPVRWSNVWLVESDSPRGRTVMTDDQLRTFAISCLTALGGGKKPVVLSSDRTTWGYADPTAPSCVRECPCCGSWVDE